jgi:hypothetical protein
MQSIQQIGRTLQRSLHPQHNQAPALICGDVQKGIRRDQSLFPTLKDEMGTKLYQGSTSSGEKLLRSRTIGSSGMKLVYRGCAEHGQVPMMVRINFGSRSREYNGSDSNEVNIYGHEYKWMDERRIQIMAVARMGKSRYEW